jgi:sugar-specific transcriptional regulator TrmB
VDYYHSVVENYLSVLSQLLIRKREETVIPITETVVRDRMVSRLKELELPTHEALAYITLLMHSSMTAGALCKETGIPDSKIYHALDGLSKKGMLIVQRGNPNVYRPAPPKEAVASLKQQLTEAVNEKIKEADVLVDVLTPIYESAEKSEELEVAYIIRGQKNIMNRMKALIEAARKEITVFIPYPAVLKELKEPLIEAKDKHRVKLNIALTRKVLEKENFSGLGDVRLLCCSVGMLISDLNTLLTLSDWIEETAMLTQDHNMIRVARDYYDNPACCKDMP